MNHWLLLHYNLSSKPSERRVYIWRKLKRLGAILVQDAVWILPDTPRSAEHLRWLVTEIQEMNGEAFLWRSNVILEVQESALVKRFMDQVDQEYEALLKKMNQKTLDLTRLSQEYQQILGKDYFHSETGLRVRAKLLAQRGRAK